MDLRVSEVVSDWGLRDSAAYPVRLGRDAARRPGHDPRRPRGPGRLPRLAPAHAGSRWSGCSSRSACSPSSSTRSSTAPAAPLPASRVPSSSTPTARPSRPGTSPTPSSCGASPAGRPSSTACRRGCSAPSGALSVVGPLATGAGDGVAGLPLGHRRRGGRRPWGSCSWAWFTHSTQSFCHAGYVPEQAGRPRSGSRGRLLAPGGVLGAALVLGCPAARVPPRTPPAAPAAQCQITDPRLPELSGLVGRRRPAARDQRRRRPGRPSSCSTPPARSSTCTPPAVDPYDPEDLARRRRRHGLAGRHRRQRRHPPDGRADRAAAGRVDGRLPADLSRRCRTTPRRCCWRRTARPYVVTKEILGASGVYRPAAALVDGGTVALAKVAAVNLTFTGTAGRPGRAGRPAARHRRSGRRATAARSGPAHLHRRLRLAAHRLRRAGAPWPPRRCGSRCRTRRRARRSASRADNRNLARRQRGPAQRPHRRPAHAGDRGRADRAGRGGPVPSLTDLDQLRALADHQRR